MEFKGSKGPWNLSPAILQVYSSPNDENDKESGDAVCDVIKGDWGDSMPAMRMVGNTLDNRYECYMDKDVYGHTPKERAEANAKLITSAPDMLEAMQEFCDRVDRGEVRSKYTYEKFKGIIEKATK